MPIVSLWGGDGQAHVTQAWHTVIPSLIPTFLTWFIHLPSDEPDCARFLKYKDNSFGELTVSCEGSKTKTLQ